jgi:hypothetical protein
MDAEASSPVKNRKTVALALGAVGLASAIGGVWLFSIPLAEYAMHGYLNDRDVRGQFEIESLGFRGARLSGIQIGATDGPGVSAEMALITLAWGWTGPRLDGVTVDGLSVRSAVDENGLNLGGLEKLFAAGGQGEAKIPAIRLDLRNARLINESAFGVVEGVISTSGRLTGNFTGRLDLLAPATANTRLRNLAGRINVRTNKDGVTLIDGNGGLGALLPQDGDDFTARDVQWTLKGAAPPDLKNSSLDLVINGGETTAFGFNAQALTLTSRLVTRMNDSGPVWVLDSSLKTDDLNGLIGGPEVIVSVKSRAAADGGIAGDWRLDGAPIRVADYVRAGAFAASGTLSAARKQSGFAWSARGGVSLVNAQAIGAGQRFFRESFPTGAGTPMATLLSSTRQTLIDAGENFTAQIPLAVSVSEGAQQISTTGPITLEGANNARAILAPVETLTIDLKSRTLSGGAQIALSGGGLPRSSLTLSQALIGPEKLELAGTATVEEWRAGGDTLATSPIQFSLTREKNAGRFMIDGVARGDISGGGIALKGMETPVKVKGDWAEGFTLTSDTRCTPLAFRNLRFAGIIFDARQVNLCGDAAGVLLASDAAGQWRGGANFGALRWSGRLENGGQGVDLSIADVATAFTGRAPAPDLTFTLRDPQLSVAFSPQRIIAFNGERIDGATRRVNGQLRIEGRFEDATFRDPALPARVTQIAGNWRAASEHGQTVIRVEDARAFVEDIPTPVPDGEARPRYNPLRLSDVGLALIDGQITGGGDILLADPTNIALQERRLATFTTRHLLSTGEGDGVVTARDLQFGADLDLYEVSDLARGVVNDVTGPVNATLNARWRRDAFATDGVIRFDDLNLNAAAIGPVNGLSGVLNFEDLLALRTAPDQKLTIQRINPGVAVDNGEIALQILNPQEVRISGARWPFAGGELSIAPQTVVIGEDTFRMRLQLSGVDMESLLKTLNFKDLSATGRVGGVFELRFDRTGGFIERSELRAEPGGGRISYIGAAGDGFTGFPKVAFDALRSFAYDALVVEISGPLDGDIVSDIRFEGENVAPISGVDIAGANILPGVDRIKATGLPFRYKVSVRAPFRRLVENYQSTQDARPLVDEAIRREQGQVDQEGKPPQ